MKTVFITTLLLLVCLAAMAQSPAEKEHGLKGQVKSVIIETTDVSPETGAITRTTKLVKGFDREGRLTELVDFESPSGKLWRTITFEYAEDGSEQETTLMADGTTADKVVYKPTKRDSEGRVIETTVFKADGSIRNRGVAAYDSQGRFSEGSSLNPDGSLARRNVVVYDDNGKVGETAVYGRTGDILQQNVRDRDTNEWTLLSAESGRVQFIHKHQPLEEVIDIHGNWTIRKIAMTITERGKLRDVLSVIKRTIIYY
ncbi:MAG: hypothetical protein ABJB97_07560 [Acidobacteriota bacterium]